MAGIIGMIPLTPGGLGLVEASLTGLLVLAEVNSSQAVLATLTYRIASYWVPLCAGPIAYGVFKFRHRNETKPEAGLFRAAPFGSHGHQPRGEIRAGLTSTATRRSSAITRS